MTTIDIRENVEEITAVRFADTCRACAVRNDSGKGLVLIDTDSKGDACFYYNDIDNLIKALQKAKELWGNE